MRVQLDMAANELMEHYYGSDLEVETSENGDKGKKWQPKEWRMEYERVVMMDLTGLMGYEIAEKTGYTPQHVYNILGCDEAIAIQKALIGRVRKEGVQITDELKEIQELTVKRLKACLKDDEVFRESRLGFIAKGIDVMKGMGEHLKNAPTNQVTNQFVLPPSVADRFLEGLEKSDQVRLMLKEKNEIQEAEVISID